ncbi:unnamed protein product [Rotaria socialis]|uniref:Uncharacterized protein n=2 Tax=Rotaria socialis TaxID=392032 RepID=A0A818GNE4_9BILA|nr:unnamed protein product [Rotaria socialis]CAF3751529.1 unnamed protein product [Rotaria socialis]
MQLNQSIFSIQSWSFYDYQFIDFIQNKTVPCPINSRWIHFEDYLFASIGLLITLMITIKIHLTEMRFRDYYALFRCHIMNLSLICLFLTTFIFNIYSNDKTCKYEQISVQYCFLIILTNIFLMSLFRMFKNSFVRKFRFILFAFIIALITQTLITIGWLSIIKNKHLNYHHRFCFHRIEIDLCLHGQMPLFLSTIYLPIIFILTALNIYFFSRPFAIAQLLEAIISFIGILIIGSIWYMSLLFSNYPQIPYRYVAYIFLLAYMLPRVCISELERSRITVEEKKPLLHDEVQFHNGNCTIHFTNNDDDDEETNIPVRQIDRSQLNSVNNHAVIRTTEMSPGEIFSKMLDKQGTQSGGYL